jgi:mevalonate pyrophosphate decarboxylase
MKSVLQNAMEECIPKVKTSNGKKVKPIWMNNKALKKVKKKHKLFQRYLRSKSGRDYERYVEVKNNCSKLIKKTRKEYERHVAKESKVNPKKFWKYVQDKLR